MARGQKKTVIDTAHPHTIKKFELIEEYIKSWSQKLMLYENCNTLVFIDCMCNSGVYFDDDGNLVDGTSVLVANALLNVARKYPSKMVQLYLNDINKKKVEELKDIRAAVKQMVASLKMLPDGKKVLARLNEGLAMNKEDFEARWTAD